MKQENQVKYYYMRNNGNQINQSIRKKIKGKYQILISVQLLCTQFKKHMNHKKVDINIIQYKIFEIRNKREKVREKNKKKVLKK